MQPSGEAEAILNAQTPVTVASLRDDLLRLGVRPGMLLLTHTSLKNLGWVCGGAQAVVLALEEALGPAGTLVMPAHTGHLSDPAQWHNPPVPPEWVEPIRAAMPAFDAHLTTPRGMGQTAETFLRQPGVLRSAHPQVSFCARGPLAEAVVSGHQLAYSLGEGSPLARLYDLDGWVLLLGVRHANNTSLHLAEYRAHFAARREQQNGSPLAVEGETRWTWFDDYEVDSEDFPRIGADYEKIAHPADFHEGRAGWGAAVLLRQRPLVDFAVEWMNTHR